MKLEELIVNIKIKYMATNEKIRVYKKKQK